ncbi:amino acid adenylation domain-containing protein [Legionella quateirensis]|uniref:Polyketide synthase n=1 Tax=Legionella quateirensis TaxID=45072 RepID=A0A378KT31_9GAMM|nr:amino acid adenylation domain-containing protein [Legionella quateirensis]KTD43673.1 polyketide synthase [Legionella quateirensis]STY17339.1 polyketide synthase [Legionella quateirensis]
MTSTIECSDIYLQVQCGPKELEAGSFDVKTTCQLFEAQVARVPNQTALIYKDRLLSYNALNELTNQLARTIRSQYKKVTQTELTPDTLIPICLKRSADFVIGILAILKAGGAYVPINPEYPDTRISYILSDIQSKLMLTDTHLFDKFQAYDEHLFLMNLEPHFNESKENLHVPLNPNNLAYVIYTSGSSGNPKGVLAKHITLISQTVCASYFSADETDTVAFFSDVSFDSTTTEIWGALLSGASLFIPDNFFDLLSNPELFKTTVKEKKLTVILLTRALFDLLFTLDETVFSEVRMMMVGGEALTKHIMLKLSQSPYKPSLLINAYGPTENSTFCTTYTIEEDFSLLNSVPIGRPYSNRVGFVLDKHLQLLPIGVTGELYVGGTSLSNGYLNHPEMTQDKFIPNLYFNESGCNYPLIYKTNDLVKWLQGGNLEYIGRNDFMVKLRGYRIELGEIETRLVEYPEIQHSVVLLQQNDNFSYLAGYYVSSQKLDEHLIREHLSLTLPDYMIPSVFVHLHTLPVTTNGKLDRKALPKPILTEAISPNNKPVKSQSVAQTIYDIWSRTLNIQNFSEEQSFFDLGGNSLAAMMVRKELEDAFSVTINIVEIFQYTTLSLLSGRIVELLKASGGMNKFKCSTENMFSDPEPNINESIAIVGMACRVPGAKDAESFWNLIKTAGTNIRDFTQDELQEHGISDTLIASTSYVKRGAIFDDSFHFDADFFGYSVKDAEIMDPQHRQFLECAWEALEHSGNIPDHFDGDISVFATQGRNTYFMDHVYNQAVSDPNLFQAILGNEKDFLSTRVSFKLNLTGPSITLQSACSSSLVAIQMACENLKTKGCDMALAGGVSLFYNYGYPYQEQLIESPDGYCRAFDARAKGTVITSGVGVVVLKRLSDAIAQKDTIYAVIKGGAINNDGSSKMAFTAPSVTGQSAVIEKALKNAEVTPDTITYIESHGTGTMLGDPIEWTALHQVYQKYSNKNDYCTIGSVKTNIGHTDSAAGVFGLIKTSLALNNKILPATLNFETLNPEIASFNQLFRVSNKTMEWDCEGLRRAAISSFGLGGTNAHMILEEYSESLEQNFEPGYFLIPFSAKTRESLYAMATKFKKYLDGCSAMNLPNVAYTAQCGRAEFKYRGYFLVSAISKSEDIRFISSYLNDDEYWDVAYLFFGFGELLIRLLSSIEKFFDKHSYDQAELNQFVEVVELLYLQMAGMLWTQELPIIWEKFNKQAHSSQKTSIPTYCFTRKYYCLPKINASKVAPSIQTSEIKESQSLEKQLKDMWSKALGVAAAELHESSNFLELGGDSLSYIDLFNYIKRAFSAKFHLEELTQYNEFGSMIQYINSRVAEHGI